MIKIYNNFEIPPLDAKKVKLFIIAQYKDVWGITRNDISLNQLFLFAYSNARTNNLIPTLYSEYINTVTALSQKIDTQKNLL